jgi:putative hydrolase of the HAD superfamily
VPIRAIICDLMDVVLLEAGIADRGAWERRAGIAEGTLRTALFRSPQFRPALAGHVPEDELWREVAGAIGLVMEPSEMATAFYSAFRVNEPLVNYLRSVRPRYQTALLSNTPSGMRVLLAERCALDRVFDALLISAETGVLKPEPESFLLALRCLQVEPGEAVFLDDEERFVAGARAIGMRAVRYESAEQAIADLQACLQPGEP